jgi:hypothetical protein
MVRLHGSNHSAGNACDSQPRRGTVATLLQLSLCRQRSGCDCRNHNSAVAHRASRISRHAASRRRFKCSACSGRTLDIAQLAGNDERPIVDAGNRTRLEAYHDRFPKAHGPALCRGPDQHGRRSRLDPAIHAVSGNHGLRNSHLSSVPISSRHFSVLGSIVVGAAPMPASVPSFGRCSGSQCSCRWSLPIRASACGRPYPNSAT